MNRQWGILGGLGMAAAAALMSPSRPAGYVSGPHERLEPTEKQSRQRRRYLQRQARKIERRNQKHR